MNEAKGGCSLSEELHSSIMNINIEAKLMKSAERQTEISSVRNNNQRDQQNVE